MNHEVKKNFGVFICMILALATLLSGCNLNLKYLSADKKECKALLNYLSEHNAEGLKSMFCNIISASKDFDEQIQNALDFFEGTITARPSVSTGYTQTVHYGEYKLWNNSATITNIVTSADKKYKIMFNSYIAYAADRNREGIAELTIECSDGTKCVVGDYYKVNPENSPLYGSKITSIKGIAEQAMNCIVSKNKKDLLALFSSDIQNNHTLQTKTELDRAFAFIDGKIISREYDGIFNFKEGDEEKVFEFEKVHFQCDTKFGNVTTDTDLKYEIWITYYDTWGEKPQYDGISKIKITNAEDPEDCVEVGFIYPRYDELEND